MRVLYILLTLGSLVGCTTNSSIPDAKALEGYRTSAAALFRDERAALEQQRASGAITAEEYQKQLAALELRIDQRATDAAWTRHALAEAERKISGIPTPDAPQIIQVPQAGASMGGTPTQGTYRRFNEQDLGFTANAPTAKEFFRGYTPGGSVRGNQAGLGGR